MKKRQKFYNITNNRNSPVMVVMCTECIVNLTMEKPPYKYSWPAFIYNLLMDQNIQQHYGEDIWKFIPVTWRYWWIDEVNNNLPTLEDATFYYPTSYVNDIIHKIREWKMWIGSYYHVSQKLRIIC